MRKGSVALVLLFVYIRKGSAARVRNRVNESIQHPACAEAPGQECSCSTLYDEFVEECSRMIRQSHDSKVLEVDCDVLVNNLWNNKDPPKNKRDPDFNAAFKVFLTPALATDASEDFEDVLISFWAGFSHSLGTRQTMDTVLERISSATLLLGQQYSIHDIEHETHGVGRVLRRLNWGRQCHQSRHDADLWKALSRSYAAGAQNLASKAESKAEFTRGRNTFRPGVHSVQRFRSQVYILYNYALEKPLEETFLFKHELNLLTAFRYIKLLDFKNECDQTLITKIAQRMEKEPWQVRCYHPGQKNFHPGVLPLHEHNERAILYAMGEGSKEIEQLEAEYSQGIYWQTIRRNSPKHASTKEESAAECRQSCISYRDCAHFNYHLHNGTCEILNRNDELKYIAAPGVLSGTKPRR